MGRLISVRSRGDFNNMENFLKTMVEETMFDSLNHFARQGVDALVSATPVDSGLTAASWGYEIIAEGGSYSIVWTNSNSVNGVPIAILLQYGHGTGTGGYVQGRDYINPAIAPIFDRIAKEVWRVVTNA